MAVTNDGVILTVAAPNQYYFAFTAVFFIYINISQFLFLYCQTEHRNAL